jgi:23S rRNA pseudouridine955/2504/2580 synthase
MKKIIVGKNDVAQRLDSFLKKKYPKLSLSALYKAIRTKQIKVNQKKAKIDYHLNLGDVIEVYLNDALISKTDDKLDFLLAPPKISVVYEDDNILLVNKPKGLLAHEDNVHTVDNLINRIKHYLYVKKA